MTIDRRMLIAPAPDGGLPLQLAESAGGERWAYAGGRRAQLIFMRFRAIHA